MRQNARSIAALAIPLVFVTMAAVAVVVHEVVGLGWAESFVLDAIVSPTDAMAPAEIMRRVGAPRRLVAIVEGENLTNDWTALILYRVAVAAVVSGSFTLWKAGLEFVASGIGGVIVGLAAGWLIRQVRGAVPARGPPAARNPRRPIGCPTADLVLWGALVSAVVIGVRLAWTFTLPYGTRLIDRRESQRARRIPADQRLVVGWAGASERSRTARPRTSRDARTPGGA